MTDTDTESVQEGNPGKAAAKPTALPTVVVGVRELTMALADYVLATTDTSHEPGIRAKVLATRAMCLVDGSKNKWAQAVAVDRQTQLDLDGES